MGRKSMQTKQLNIIHVGSAQQVSFLHASKFRTMDERAHSLIVAHHASRRCPVTCVQTNFDLFRQNENIMTCVRMMNCYVLTRGCRCAYRICFFSFLIAVVFEGVLHLAHGALRHTANTHETLVFFFSCPVSTLP